MSQNQNRKQSNKKRSLFQSLAILIVALLLLAGQHLGILPEMDEGGNVIPTLAPTSTPATALQGGSVSDEKISVPTVKPTVKATVKATAKPTATLKPTATPDTKKASGPIIEPQAIADYLFEHGELPDNFITKAEAQAMGWDSSKNDVSDVAPGKSIGGDRFGNYEGLLPKASGRQYYEADCYYTKGNRNSYRIVYSNDGLVYYTDDHYESFTQMFPSKK